MANYKDMLTAAMAEGKSVEDVLKEITAAANAVQAEQEAAKKYDRFKQILDMEGSVYMRRLGTAPKISVDDMATVFTHFLCQNVPGYAAYCVKEDKDPFKGARVVVDNYLTMTKAEVESAGKSPDERLGTMLDTFFSKLGEQLAEELSEIKPKADKSDAERMARFFKSQGL